jgi:hypothetical protein
VTPAASASVQGHDPPLYGLLAEFQGADALVDAATRVREAGYARVDAYAPFSVPGLPEAVGFRRDRVALVTLIGGILGGSGIYFLQWFSAVIDYPINSGGRPFNSWPAFIPATFECTVLGAALFAFAGYLIMSGLPKLHHPIFNAREFDLATRNRFFVCIESADPRFDRADTARFLESLGAMRVSVVPFS